MREQGVKAEKYVSLTCLFHRISAMTSNLVTWKDQIDRCRRNSCCRRTLKPNRWWLMMDQNKIVNAIWSNSSKSVQRFCVRNCEKQEIEQFQQKCITVLRSIHCCWEAQDHAHVSVSKKAISINNARFTGLLVVVERKSPHFKSTINNNSDAGALREQ